MAYYTHEVMIVSHIPGSQNAPPFFFCMFWNFSSVKFVPNDCNYLLLFQLSSFLWVTQGGRDKKNSWSLNGNKQSFIRSCRAEINQKENFSVESREAKKNLSEKFLLKSRKLRINCDDLNLSPVIDFTSNQSLSQKKTLGWKTKHW